MMRFIVVVTAVVGLGLGISAAASASVGPVYDSCSEAHDDGVWDIPESDDAYWHGGDRDDDGIACESYS